MKKPLSNHTPTIAVLGIGWLGLPLIEYLAQKQYKIHAANRSEENIGKVKNKIEKVFSINVTSEKIEGDITSFLAADVLIVTIPPNRKLDRAQAQLEPLIPFINNSSIRNVLYTSSTGVYPATNSIVTEVTPIKNTNHPCYQNEQALQQSTNFNTTILRLAGLIGAERHPGKFFSKNGIIPNGDMPINLVHRQDVITTIEKVLLQDSWKEIYNVCASTHPTKADFYTAAAASIGKQLQVEQQTSDFKIINNQKTKDQLEMVYQYDDLIELLGANNWQ